MVQTLSFTRRVMPRLALVAVLTSSVSAAEAQVIRAAGYAPSYGDAVAYGFADEAVRGAYVGAPLTQFPSPNRIVPAPWSYGTYGVPTLSGLRAAPVAVPSLTLINPGTRVVPARRSSGSHILSRDERGDWARVEPVAQGANGVHVIEVKTAPR